MNEIRWQTTLTLLIGKALLMEVWLRVHIMCTISVMAHSSLAMKTNQDLFYGDFAAKA